MKCKKIEEEKLIKFYYNWHKINMKILIKQIKFNLNNNINYYYNKLIIVRKNK